VLLGPALSMKASQGGTATPDTIAAHTIAVLRRGGMRPQADGSPAARRAPQERLRRRRPLRRKRAARRTPSHQTTRPDHLPELGQQIADQAHRAGVAERCAEPAGPKSLAGDLAWIGPDASRLRDRAWSVLTTANAHHPHTRDWLRTGPGLGELRRLVRLDDLHDRPRCPRVQDVVAAGRLVTGAQASAGQRDGTGGRQRGHANLTWAFSAAAGRCWRAHPSGQQDLTRMETTPGTGKALTSWAPHVAHAVAFR